MATERKEGRLTAETSMARSPRHWNFTAGWFQQSLMAMKYTMAFSGGRRGRWRSGVLEFFPQRHQEVAGDQYRDGDVESTDESVAYRERKEAAILPDDLDCRGIPGGKSCELEVH
jgi:hypothetical protein